MKINAKKFSNGDCQLLVNKVMARLKSWGCRSLSYASRVILVNSVLLNLHSYWASIFIIPMEALNGIIAICRNYLWDGKLIASRSPPIAWDFISRSKTQGGLGLKDSFAWNVASKADCLWVRWIDIYVKGRDW